MSAEYSVSGTADIFSTTAPGQVNLFDTAGTFAVQLRAPSGAITPYSIALPSSTGAIGSYVQLTQTAQTLGWVPNTIVASTSCPYNERFYSSATSACTTTSAVNVSADYVAYIGSTAMGSSPTSMIAILGASNLATTMVVTVQDITNALTVASLTVSSATFTGTNVPNSINMGAITNISASGCIWQILIRRSAGAGTVQFYGFQIIG